MSKKLLALLTIILLSSSLYAQDNFSRAAVFDLPAPNPGGVGEIVAGVDFDGDGKMELYAVNDNWQDAADELIPRIYKYEFNNGQWDSVWSATLDIPLQNTWPALTSGDLDNDGKMEIIWGPVNYLNATTNPNPSRIIVFEAKGDGSDVMGADDGAGGFKPNARWNFNLADMANMRPIKWFVTDIDADSTSEIVFADRAGSSSTVKVGVASVSDIPDAGDGSETWTLEFATSIGGSMFVRSGVIGVPEIEPGGFGEIVSGVDLDGDTKMEMYAVNDDWNDTPNELIPRIYKYEWNGAYWEKVWNAVLDIPLQNTWPALAVGDLDSDGKKEVIWGPVNNLSFNNITNPNPARVVVFEVAGDGSDVLGVPDGSGNYLPNAKWTIVDADNQNERPFRWFVKDIDNDSKEEIIFAERVGTLRWGVISVSDVPNNGDGSETWTLEASALTVPTDASTGTCYDLAVVGSDIYLIYSNGNIIPIKFEGGTFVAKPVLTGVVPGGSWKASSVVDIDADSTLEIVVGGWNGSNSNVYLLQPSGDSVIVSVIGNFTSQGAGYLNGGAAGDIDGDGKLDFVFGSRTAVSNPNGSVYRLKYLGGDITNPASYESSIIDAHIQEVGGQFDIVSVGNLDTDPEMEVVYSGIGRGGDAPPIGIINYNTANTVPGGSKWDIAVIDNKIYTFDNDGSVNIVQYLNGNYQVANKLTGVADDYGSFKGSVVVDLNNDGVKEIVVGAWSSSGAGKVYLLQEMNGGLKSTLIADLSGLGAVRLNGAGAGDIDGDGNMDLVFGSRGSGSKVFRVEYIGGEIDNPANYTTQMIDEGILPADDQIDITYIANVDDDPEMEVIYSGIPRSSYPTPVPIVILDILKIVTTPIADVKIDANEDLQPDLVGQEFTILGVVTSVNFTASSNRFSYYIQDATGGINVTKGNETGGGPVYNIGDKLQVTGKVGIFRGLTQLNIDSLAQVVFVGQGTPVTPKELTLTEYMMNPEKYEATLIKLNGVAKESTSATWPAAGSDANMTITDGNMSTVLRIDKDTDIDDSTEVTWPANIVGIATQFSSGSTVYDNGYQISPNFYSDFTGGVKVPPSKYFMFTDETQATFNDTLAITAVDQQFVFKWHPSVDLNGDPLIYQLMLIDGATVKTFNPSPLSDTTITLTGTQLITALGNTSKTVKFTVRTKGSESTLVTSIDTLSTTFNILVGVSEENIIPTEFFVEQNYPNPFNPTTTIKFGLPKEATVDLRVYDILGREVAVLIDKQQRNAGIFEVQFDASRLATGTYIYRLSADNKVEIKKMLLIK